MIDLLKADWYRLRRWNVWYLWILAVIGADLLCEAVKRIIWHRQSSFLQMMISGTEQKIVFAAAGSLAALYLFEERESGFLKQTQPLCPKWKHIAEKMIFTALTALFFEALVFAEHLAKAVYFKTAWTGVELIEAEAFFVGGVFLCTAFGTAALCLMEWLRSVWPSVIVLCLFVWGWPFHLAFEKMLSVFEAETILRYGMFETFAAFSQNIEEGSFLQVIFVSCVWIIGFGGFAFLGRLRR